MEIQQENGIAERKEKFPTFKKLCWDWILGVLSLVVVLLPGILVRIFAFNPNFDTSSPSYQFVASQGFSSAVILIAFVLALIAITKAKQPGVRTLALLALIVCILRFLVPTLG